MFSERLKQIFLCIGATPTGLARSMRVDPSGISRMASGKRIPKNGGEAARNLANGIFFFADARGKIPELCELISCENTNSAEDVKKMITSWLFEGSVDEIKKQEPKKTAAPYRAIGEKLTALMTLAGLSNVRLGRLINVDTSYISRFKNGLRSPSSNPKTMDAVCTVLLYRLHEQNKLRQLGELIGADVEAIDDEDDRLALFRGWLFDTDGEDNSPIVEKLIENIDAFPSETKIPLPSFDEAADESIISADDTVYFGARGLQTAVIRFLKSAVRSGAGELLLYSDQSMEWMVGDTAFRLKWASLMLECVKRGIRIRIVHNIDRDLGEMLDAITNWLPLYMSGMIESFYCKKQKNARFSNTLFLCPGVACVKGGNVIGTEDRCGEYRYDTDGFVLSVHKTAFEQLLGASRQLVRIYAGAGFDNVVPVGETGMTVLGTTLSLATMPEKTLLKILERAGVDDTVKNTTLAVWNKRKDQLYMALSKGPVHECAPVAEDEKLFGEQIPIDLPGVTAAYTPQEYAEHIRGITEISDAFRNYRFYALPDAPFANTKIVIADGVVAVSRLKAPQVTFVISHPAMCDAFSAYAERIRSQYKQDKLSMRRMLERYF